MASFTVLPITCSVTPNYKQPSSFPLRSDSVSAFSRVSLPGGTTSKKAISSVRAGVMKFKGTQMREKHLTELIEQKVREAKEVCQGDAISDECKVAWDEVEEVSQAKAHLRVKMEKEDPLESFCGEHPETDECRIYED